jgi:uncharacterized membrane protein
MVINSFIELILSSWPAQAIAVVISPRILSSWPAQAIAVVISPRIQRYSAIESFYAQFAQWSFVCLTYYVFLKLHERIYLCRG